MSIKISIFKPGEEPLLTRDNFRERVFARDQNKCVICGKPAQDAHHILERRLFDDGGYYLSNGSSLCGTCHIQAEQTALSVENIRKACNLAKVTIPAHFYPDEVYDKWGNIMLPSGQRTKGELFSDTSVQKILEGQVQWSPYVKYPRTKHFPWSPGATEDDRVHNDLSSFAREKEVIATAKMDGENTNLYTDYYHARSTTSGSNPTQSWARQFHARIRHDIPQGWRICCENLYARHSITYDKLDSYLMVYSIWDEKNMALSWDDTLEWCSLLGMASVPLLYRGPWDETMLRKFYDPRQREVLEGYVVRPARSFAFAEFRRIVGKYVRANHVQTSHHWKESWVPNKLREKAQSG
jgi:hypothetical protein